MILAQSSQVSQDVINVSSYENAVRWGVDAGNGYLALLATCVIVIAFAKGRK